jgi:hypothetical protein
MQRIFKLGRSGPTLTSMQKTCWVGLAHAALSDPKDGVPVLGGECKSSAELQAVVAQIKLQLDEIVVEARF